MLKIIKVEINKIRFKKKQERTHAFDQEKVRFTKKRKNQEKRKKTRSRPRYRPRKKQVLLFSFYKFPPQKRKITAGKM